MLILCDTHGAPPPIKDPSEIDVAIHCADPTEESKLHEFHAAIALLKTIKADLKLAIAGNHDWTLDDAVFEGKVAKMRPTEEGMVLVEKTYGRVGGCAEDIGV
jgi:predicted phosphodiesterase